MKPYTESEPVFSDSIEITETTDPAHADNINAAPKQLLQNTLVNRKAIQELENGNQMVEFEDYSGEGAKVPEPEEAVAQVASGKADKVFRQYVKASLKGMLNLVQRALSIAMGKNQARVFATVEALDAWLAVPANVQQLNVGDNFYITATDVPDYWWDGKQKQKLETQKVDLTTYDQRITANASAINELNGNISSHSHAWSAITGKPGTFPSSDHNHDDRYYTETEVNNLINAVKPKSIMVHLHGVATNQFKEPFGSFKYFGGVNGEPIIQKVDELRNNNHTILGGFIARGGFNDEGYAGNMVNMAAITVQYSYYYNVPYEIMFFSDAYQTIHYDIVILYY